MTNNNTQRASQDLYEPKYGKILLTIGKIFLLIIAVLIGTGIFQMIGLFISGYSLEDIAQTENHSTTFLLLGQALGFVAFVPILLLFHKGIDKQPIISLGFHVKERFYDFIWGFVLAAVLIGGGTFVLTKLGLIELSYNEMNWYLFIQNFMLFSLVSLQEEILVRGYILNRLTGVMNKHVALIISSIIFMTMHLLNPNLSSLPITNLFLAGIILGMSYIYTRNLWFPISLHLFWNFIQGPVLGYAVSGQNTESIFSVRTIGDNQLLHGGTFGFEGSLICTISSFFIILSLLLLFEKRKLLKPNNETRQ